MHPALAGFLAGLGLAAFFVLSEYVLLSNAAKEKAKALKRKPVWDDIAKKRMRAIWAFAIFLPPAFAIAGWMLLPIFGYTGK